MADLKDGYTHVSKLRGKYRTRTTAPTDANSGPAGILAGDMFLNTTDNNVNIYTGSKWAAAQLTTTSTSTSTSTTTSTTTTA